AGNQAECPGTTSQRRTSSLLPLSDMEDERGYLLVPHEPDCDGFWMVVERGDMAEIKCNSCGEVIDTVPIERAGSRLMELAGAEMMCSARCPHCGRTRTDRFCSGSGHESRPRGLRTLVSRAPSPPGRHGAGDSPCEGGQIQRRCPRNILGHLR